MVIHGIVSVLLIIVILMQSGRGGGLTEGFASAESMFGAQTNEFMIKATTVFATIFLILCLGLAFLSAQKGKSLMSSTIASETQPSTTAQTDDAVDGGTDANIPDEGTSEATIKESMDDSLSEEDAPINVIPEPSKVVTPN
jgi:preprotein translocase subunit SecG